jgi:hypothetical protein
MGKGDAKVKRIVAVALRVAKRRAISATVAAVVDSVFTLGTATIANELVQAGYDVSDAGEIAELLEELVRELGSKPKAKSMLKKGLKNAGVPSSVIRTIV